MSGSLSVGLVPYIIVRASLVSRMCIILLTYNSQSSHNNAKEFLVILTISKSIQFGLIYSVA